MIFVTVWLSVDEFVSVLFIRLTEPSRSGLHYVLQSVRPSVRPSDRIYLKYGVVEASNLVEVRATVPYCTHLAMHLKVKISTAVSFKGVSNIFFCAKLTGRHTPPM